MKKILLTFVLLVGIVAGLFAQKLTYQAVIRDNNQQLVVNTAVKATVTITFTSGAPYQAEFNGSTNLHGLLSIEFGDESLVGRDWTGAFIAVKVVNSATPSIVYVNDDPRPVSAVPYALSVDGMAIQQYLTEHHYVTEMQVGNQIHDSISNIAAKAHTHDNKALLDTYTQTEANLADAVNKKHSHENMSILNATTAPYTDADSTKLDGIAAGAEVNVQSDWKQTDGSKDDYIKNKPSITDTVNNILSTGGYVTTSSLEPLLQQLVDRLAAQDAKIDTLRHLVDSLTKHTPIVTTTSVTSISQNSATSGGNVTADGGANVTARGVCWSTSQNPTIADSHTTDGSGTGSFASSITGLFSETTYYVRAYATNSGGTAYGNQVSFTTARYGQPCTGAPTVSDGTNTYNTVKIGNQCWMAQNLRTTTKRNGVGNIYTGNTQAGYNAETYGYYYDWAAVMQDESGDKVRGICPEGWHVPSDAEWTQLTDYVKSKAEYKCGEGADNIANALSSHTGWTGPSSCGAGNNSTTLNKTGFSAVPAGFYDGFYDGPYNDFGTSAKFWSATLHGSSDAYSRNLYRYSADVGEYYNGKGNGFSVRCLRD